jgi:two-component system, oxyanion-binding sensor
LFVSLCKRPFDRERADRLLTLAHRYKFQTTSNEAIRVGFVPLIDAAPLIVAHELGYFVEENVSVILDRQIGWGNVRDKLSFGNLQASQCVLGMPLASHLGDDRFAEPLVSVMSLGSGGNGITLSSRLVESGVNSASALAQHIKAGSRGKENKRKLVLGHVFNCSMHHYLLRDWLAGGGIDPDQDVCLRVVPPPLMADQLYHGHLDGFCVGEPWNTVAAAGGYGEIVAATTDILPSHPEKVLAVSLRWAHEHPATVSGLVKAALRGCIYCNNPANLESLGAMLAKPGYLNVPVSVMKASLSPDRNFGLGVRSVHQRPKDWELRSFSPEKMFPSRTHVAWLGSQMVRWRHAPTDTDWSAISRQCTDGSWFRAAASSLSIACPASDSPPMRLRNGVFELKESTAGLVRT